MDTRQIVSFLRSGNEDEMLEAIYSIDEDQSKSPEIISELRKLITEGSSDVREISIMRLACRSKDVSIFDKLKENINNGTDILVFSASVRGLGCLSGESFEGAEDLLDFFKSKKIGIGDEERDFILDKAIKDIVRFNLK